MPNETLLKFGYPQNILAEYEHWAVLLRPKQVTAGCVVLACKGDATCLPDVGPNAYAELTVVTADLECALRAAFNFDKINYLLLMMVDKHVHWHVIPRYAESRDFAGTTFNDRGWPMLPDMTTVTDLASDDFAALRARLRELWPKEPTK